MSFNHGKSLCSCASGGIMTSDGVQEHNVFSNLVYAAKIIRIRPSLHGPEAHGRKGLVRSA